MPKRAKPIHPHILSRPLPMVCIHDSECWTIAYRPTSLGYAQVTANANGRTVMALAHRLFYQKLIGQLDPELTLDHLCRNRACVNPAHLEQVANRVNVLRGIGWAAINARKAHCPHGHALIESNLYRFSNGRHCRTCCLQRQRQYRQKRKGQTK